jgi:hypothetical protein
VAAAAAALWPQAAGAGVPWPPDQSATGTFYVEVTTCTDGGAITASSGGSGGLEFLAVGGVARADRSIHSISFTACSCGDTIELHPK